MDLLKIEPNDNLSFLIDGLPYQRGKYKYDFDAIDQERIGILEYADGQHGKHLAKPRRFDHWIDENDLPYLSVQDFLDRVTPFFFRLVSSSNALIPESQRVDTFADLPTPASDYTDQVWYVRQQTGTWILGTYRASGTYRSNGSEWVKDNEITQFFVDNNMMFKDDIDATKTMQFELSTLPAATNRIVNPPTSDGVLAIESQVTPKLDSVQGGTRIDIDNTDPNNPVVNVDPATDAEITANTGKVSADGSVTTHSDVTSAGSGQIITNAERAGINGLVTVHSDVTSSGSGEIITDTERDILLGEFSVGSNFSGNINNAIPVTIPLVNLNPPNNSGYTSSGLGIELPFSGKYKLGWKFAGEGGSNFRANVAGILQVNNVDIPSTFMPDYASRNNANNSGGCSVAPHLVSNTFTQGDIITLIGYRADTQVSVWNIIPTSVIVIFQYLGP